MRTGLLRALAMTGVLFLFGFGAFFAISLLIRRSFFNGFSLFSGFIVLFRLTLL